MNIYRMIVYLQHLDLQIKTYSFCSTWANPFQSWRELVFLRFRNLSYTKYFQHHIRFDFFGICFSKWWKTEGSNYLVVRNFQKKSLIINGKTHLNNAKSCIAIQPFNPLNFPIITIKNKGAKNTLYQLQTHLFFFEQRSRQSKW